MAWRKSDPREGYLLLSEFIKANTQARSDQLATRLDSLGYNVRAGNALIKVAGQVKTANDILCHSGIVTPMKLFGF